MKRIAATLALALGLSSLVVIAQDAGLPAGRGERPAPREGDRPPGPGMEGPRPPVMPLVAALDANGDGVIDADEIAKASAALKTLDKNGDGKLSGDESRLAPPAGFGGPGAPPMGGPGDREAGPRGRQGGPPGDRAGQARFESAPLPKDDAEKKILAVLDDMNRNESRGMMSVPRDDGRSLRILTESLGAKNVVEIGTSHGYSAIWQCLALRTTGGKLTTFEIDAQRAALARQNFKRAGVESIVTLVEGDAHKEMARLKDPIDIVFLDADKEGYIDYLNKLLPLVRPGGLIVAHNMNARQADPRYVKAITTDPKLETLFVNLGASDIGLTLKKR
jgi:caffeoyl-CoA O-methyltransferase